MKPAVNAGAGVAPAGVNGGASAVKPAVNAGAWIPPAGVNGGTSAVKPAVNAGAGVPPAGVNGGASAVKLGANSGSCPAPAGVNVTSSVGVVGGGTVRVESREAVLASLVARGARMKGHVLQVGRTRHLGDLGAEYIYIILDIDG